MKTKLVSDEIEYSLPRLLVCRRDVTMNNNRETSFAETLNRLELFQPNFNIILIVAKS